MQVERLGKGKRTQMNIESTTFNTMAVAEHRVCAKLACSLLDWADAGLRQSESETVIDYPGLILSPQECLE